MADPTEEEQLAAAPAKAPNAILSALDIPQPVAPAPAPPLAAPVASNAPPPDPQLIGPNGLPPAPPPPTPVASGVQPFAPPGPQTTSNKDSQTQFTAGHKLDPKIQAEIHNSQATELDAVSEKTRLQANADKQMAQVEQRRAEDEARLRSAQEQAAAQRKQMIDEHAQKVAAAQKEVDAIKGPPEEDQSLGHRIVNAIALGLGAFGASINGGPNQAAQIIAANREQKMTAWKAQYERAKGKVASQENLYALFRNKGLDEETAEALAIKNLNDSYASVIRSQLAESKAPLTLATGNAELERLKQQNLEQDQKVQQAAQGTFTTIKNDREVTKAGGDSKEQKDLNEQVNNDEYIKKYRLAQSALGRFTDFVKAGATGAAFTDFVAGKGGMDQGSFGPSVQAMIHKNGWWGQSVEDIRAKLHGGVQPEVIHELSNALAIDAARTRAKAAPAITHYQRAFHAAGMDPRMITGGDTADEAAAAVGAAPSAYQGRQ